MAAGALDAVDAEPADALRVGGEIHALTCEYLGSLTPADVSVELYLGRVTADGEIAPAQVTPMLPSGPDGKHRYLFEAAAVPCRHSGLRGYTVRVIPGHPDRVTQFLPGLITRAGPDVKAS